ncbi:hypothetical protein V1277_001764 [Bradyrhizobium sp. AZCC 1588]
MSWKEARADLTMLLGSTYLLIVGAGRRLSSAGMTVSRYVCGGN